MKRKFKVSVAMVLSVVLLAACANSTESTISVNENNITVKEKNEASSVEEDAEKTASQPASHSIKEKNLPLYKGEIDYKEDVNIYYIDGSMVPYISVDTIKSFLNDMQDTDCYELECSGEHVIFTRTGTKLTCDFDFSENTITFYDYDAFLRRDVGPLVNVGIPEFGPTQQLYKEVEFYSYDRYGKVMTIDLKPYEIMLVHEKDGYYAPLQTVSDLIMTYDNNYILCNGEAVFLLPGVLDDEIAEIYYSASGERTEEFAKFDYNELCLALDYLYGLKEVHNISNFDDYIFECGLRNKFLSTDQTEVDIALNNFISYQLDDLHSSYNNCSYMSDKEAFLSQTKGVRGPSASRFVSNLNRFYDIREAAFPEGFHPYEEVGDTAFITFDKFTHPIEDIDYMSEPKEDELYDTIRLMQYSRDKILRTDSPVKNVVMDLSNNTGGAAVSAAYVIAFYLGLGDLSVINTMTGAAGVAAYEIDTNRDGEFTEDDYLASKGINLYCLISPVSFSCGNLVPNAFMISPKVSLIGMTSGGGSCGVLKLTTAGGSMIQISGSKRISILKNGSFYDIDRGATPDYCITKISNYYDREFLTEWIDALP